MIIYTVQSIEDCFGTLAYNIDELSIVVREGDSYTARIIGYPLTGAEPREENFPVRPCYDHITGKIIGFVRKER